MSAALHSPNLAAELRELQARLDRLERTPDKGARDEPCPMSPYPWWPGNSTFNKVLSFPIGGVNNPVIRAEFNYQLGGSGVIEFRLRDFSTNTVTGVYTAGTGGTFTLRCDWLYPMGDGFVRGGTWRRVEVQARVASGTPTLSVWPWITVGTQLSVATNASASGFWTLNP